MAEAKTTKDKKTDQKRADEEQAHVVNDWFDGRTDAERTNGGGR